MPANPSDIIPTEPTRDLMVKSGAEGRIFPTHPNANPGEIPGGIGHNYRITGIPQDVSDAKVMRLFEGTANATWVGGRTGRFVFDYSELRVGKLIMD